MGLIYKALFPSISTFETPPSIQGERIQTIQRSSCVASEVKDSRW